MSRPTKIKSVEADTGTGPGQPYNLGGRITVALQVETDGDAAGGLTVDLEARLGDSWAKLRDGSGEQVGQVTEAELDEDDGTHTAFVAVHGVNAEQLRANVEENVDGVTVDAWVAGSSNPNSAQQHREVGG